MPGCRELLGDGSDDLVSFVNLPKMQGIDRPFPNDWDRLEAELATGIRRMTERVLAVPGPAHDEIGRITLNAGWAAVFQRVEGSYRKAIDRSV